MKQGQHGIAAFDPAVVDQLAVLLVVTAVVADAPQPAAIVAAMVAVDVAAAVTMSSKLMRCQHCNEIQTT